MVIKDFLLQLGLDQYIDRFEESGIEIEMLSSLSDQELKEELGMKLGHRIKLRQAVQETQPGHSVLDEEIINYPSILSFAITEYIKEENPKIKLWAICDFFELYMRFHVIVGLALTKQNNGLIPEKLLRDVQNKIEHPTLGKWIGMVQAVEKFIDPSHTLHQPFQKFAHFLEEGELSILTLRNTLAHGGGISKKSAFKLLKLWDPAFQDLIQSLQELSHYHLVVKTPEGNLAELRGPYTSTSTIYQPESSAILAKVENLLSHSSSVVLIMKEEVISLWPLIFYHQSDEKETGLQNIYVRRGDLSLEYTPIGSTDSFLNKSDQDTLQHFIQFFKLNRLKEKEVEQRFLVSGFRTDILSDSKKLVGREKELNQIRERLTSKEEGVFWITGHAGIGKSYLTASIINEFFEEPSEKTLILPYRFKAGDDRCYRNEFIIFAVERLNHWEGSTINLTKSATTYNIHDLQHLLHSIKSDHQVLFVLDGFDELPSQDLKLANEIVHDLQVNRVQWLCAGRPNTYLEDVFSSERCFRVFPNGVPPMSKEDVLSMILDKIGPLRKKLIHNQIEKNEDEVLSPFIEKVWDYSEGFPLYVTYVIGDILSNRIQYFDGKSDKLPPSIHKYHEELLKRCSIDIYNQILPRMVATIALAKEALSFEFLQDLLIKQDLSPIDPQEARKTIHQSLTYISTMLKRISIQDGQKEGYTLYHTSLRDYIEGPEAPLLQTARRALIKQIQIQPDKLSEVDLYLLRWGITHLLEDQDSDHSKRIDELLSSFEYLYTKSEHQKVEFFFDDVYNGYKKVSKNKDGNSVLTSFLRVFVALEQKGNLSIETLHAFFVYREDQRFYEQLLWIATNKKIDFNDIKMTNRFEELYPSFLSRLANFQRRNGKLDNAKVILKRSLDLLERTSKYGEMARIQYDIGYIHYLQGNPSEADQHFESSKAFAKMIEDEVGYWISKCVQYHTGQFDKNGEKTTNDFKHVLEEALPVFRTHAKRHHNENARRWIKNVYAHSFKVAYEEKNLAQAQDLYNKLLENEWIKKYRNASLVEYEARLCVLERNYEEAASLFASYLSGEESDLQTESKAKEFLEYAKVLLILQNPVEAKRIAQKGLQCPIEFGNTYFIEELKEILAVN